VATALSLLVFVALANAVVDLYARGVARAAVDEGARAGAVLDASAADCEARAHEVFEGSVPRGSVRVDCTDDGGAMHARARVSLAGWLPGLPTWTFVIDGAVVKERLP
jgi:hypothetical protein